MIQIRNRTRTSCCCLLLQRRLQLLLGELEQVLNIARPSVLENRNTRFPESSSTIFGRLGKRTQTTITYIVIDQPSFPDAKTHTSAELLHSVFAGTIRRAIDHGIDLFDVHTFLENAIGDQQSNATRIE